MDPLTAAPSDKKPIVVTKQQADKLHEQAKQFQQKFEKQQAEFSHSQDQTYFIVSSKFLSEWRDYATSHSLERVKPSHMNVDILQNNKLKPQLKQGQDFEFLSQNLFAYFKDYEGVALKRKAIRIGNQKRIPVYLKQYKYLIIMHDDLRAIDRSGLSQKDLQIHSAQASEQSTIEDFLQIVKEKQRYSQYKDLRIWKIGQKTISDVFRHIKKQTNPIRSYQYKIQFLGKKITQQKAKLGDIQFSENQFLVIQVKEDNKKWHLFSDSEGKCQGCYLISQLKFPCGCKKVAYCSEQCQQKDKRFHLRSCQYAQMQQMNKLVEMKITQTSARGRVGLSNLGNTCFMNSCLQCLSNTLPLTEYFIGGHFQKQINKVNPIGTKGKLAKTYAKFIKSMWCDSNTTFSPYNIKNAVSSINPMFSGFAQHDSQQFFSFLVDGLHEDLNRIETKPYVQSVDSNGREDRIVALQSWIVHMKRNQSIIVDLMTGQYRSKVTCPDCGVQSITFDPFITVTLPIPQKVVNSFAFFLIYSNMNKKTQRYYLNYEKVKAQDWIQTASKLTGLKPEQFGMYVVSVGQGIYKVGRQSTAQILHKIQSQNKNMFLVQYSQQDLKIKNKIQISVRFAKRSSYQYDNIWFKFPHFFDRNQMIGINIYRKLLRFLYAEGYIYNGKFNRGEKKTLEEYLQQMLDKRPFKLVLKHGRKLERTYHKLEYSYEEEEQISDDTNVGELIQKYPQGDCEIDARFVKSSDLQSFSFQTLKDFDDKMKKPVAKSSEDVTVSIDQCFQHFRQVQKLQAGNQWYCPKCKDHKQADKQLSIYKAPKILILHLKRFKQKGMVRKQKNQSKVQFPLELNMSEYLLDPKPMSSYIQEARKLNVYIEPKTQKPVSASQQPIYQLYAVSNHYGGLGGGHYTAYAKNNGKWFDYNDSSVRQCSQSSIGGSGAYILFYKRKD